MAKATQENSGLNEVELGALREEVEILMREVEEVDSVGEYDRIRGELLVKQKIFNDMKRERTSDISGLCEKLGSIKQFEKNL